MKIPRKKESEKLIKRVYFRLTEAEYWALKKTVLASRYSKISDYVRSKLYSTANSRGNNTGTSGIQNSALTDVINHENAVLIARLDEYKQMRNDLLHIGGEISKIGNNLNQIAYKLHTDQSVTVTEVKENISLLSKYMTTIRSQLLDLTKDEL